MTAQQAGTKQQRILLTGARGFLGSRIAEAMELTAAPSLRGMTDEQLRQLVEEAEPECIIHTAALADTAQCERDEAASWEANVLLPLRLAKAAQGVKLVMLSTDQVYNGTGAAGPFQEDMPLAPVNVYGRHKLEMERRVLEVAPDAVMLRATWLYDMPRYGDSKHSNIMMQMLRAGLTHSSTAWSSSLYRGLSYAREAAAWMAQAIRLPGGAYNYGSENNMSMYETAAYLLGILHAKAPLEEGPVRPNLWIDGAKARAHGIDFSSTQEGLKRCLKDYGLAD